MTDAAALRVELFCSARAVIATSWIRSPQRIDRITRQNRLDPFPTGILARRGRPMGDLITRPKDHLVRSSPLRGGMELLFIEGFDGGLDKPTDCRLARLDEL